MVAYAELTAAGTTTRATATRRTRHGEWEPVRQGRTPANRLTGTERDRVLEVFHRDEFIDQPPAQVYATLLTRAVWLCSIAAMYRILAAAAQVKECRRLARHPARAVPELVAEGPGQVYIWDITKLTGPVKAVYYDAYVMIDIYSRYIVGAHVHARESAPLAEDMMRRNFGIHGIPQVVHADRGTSMTSKPVSALLADFVVTRSHSRPSVSNDNPYSEAWFTTLKYAPVLPDRFGSLADARAFMAGFVEAYNHDHHHAGIGLHTSADVHYGHARTVSEQSSPALAAARTTHPERFSTTADPKILVLPTDAWINRPPDAEPAAA